MALNKLRNCIDKDFLWEEKIFGSYADIKTYFMRLILFLKGFLGLVDVKSFWKILL